MAEPASFDRQELSGGLFDLPVVRLIERANQIAATSLSLDALLMRTLGLMLEECQAVLGAVYLLDAAGTGLVCRSVRGLENFEQQESDRALASSWQGMSIQLEEGPMGEALRAGRPVHLKKVDGSLGGDGMDPFSQRAQESVYYAPLVMPRRVIGLVQFVDPQALQPDLLRVISNRMVTEIDKALQVALHAKEIARKDRLILILGQIGATLDPDEVLRLLIDYGRQVINAQACSLFLVDEEQGDSVLHLATNQDDDPTLGEVRVPKGKGIIGHVIETGERILVSDVSNDQRHFRQTDQTTGFVTRAILTVPLRAAPFNQGERGVSQERIIGGLQALNKLDGTFDEKDAETLSTLAKYAATVFRMASAVAENDQLFMDMIQWMIAAIDARDPYTEGHSKRVSEYSVEISRQLKLPAETVYQVRIGSLLHDIGKIGVPDAILRKPERLTDEEYTLMKQHPLIGARMMKQVHSLQHVLPALSEHHERLDGKGYPRGLKGDDISLFGRIVAVADVFDAMTSKRPYREGSSAEEALDYLYNRVNTEFDTTCVDALTRAYLSGDVKTQRERQILNAS